MQSTSYNVELLKWRKRKTGVSYELIASRAGVSISVAWKFILGKTDPSVSTYVKITTAMGLDPKQVLNRKLKTDRQFRRAVVGAAR